MKAFIFVTSLLCALYVANGGMNVCIPMHSIDSYDIRTADRAQLLDALAEDLRRALAKEGDLELGHVAFDVHHPAVNARGSFDDLVLHNLTDFSISLLGPSEGDGGGFDVFNFTLHDLYIDGEYEIVEGDLGELFAIFGHGPFWLRMQNFSVAMTHFYISWDEGICFNINIDINLEEASNQFDNFLEDEELSALFNGIIRDILPESLKILWQEAKDIIEKAALKKLINDFFHNENFVKLLKMNLLTEK